MEKAYFVHPSSYIDENVSIGEGTKVWHFCHVEEGAVIGRHCVLGQNVYIGKGVRIGNGVHIQNNVSVYAGVELEDHVFCGPSCVFTNVRTPRSQYPVHGAYAPTLVKAGASLGANCTVVCGHTIGEGALVAAGAVVTGDVEDYALMQGVPARRVAWVCACGKKLGPDLRCGCGLRYEMKGTHLQKIKQ
ncbi:MAG: N-acetyltransferase [Bacteroidales bacterium]|nr:N-acetyltransferase [Bacteroidales bacterium]